MFILFIICAMFLALVLVSLYITAPQRKAYKKAKQFIEECFLQFVELSPQLPKFHKTKGGMLKWKVLYIKHKTEPLRYDEYDGQKLGGGRPFHQVTCLSVDRVVGGPEDSCTCYSDHVFKINLSDAEYKKAIDGTLSSEVLLRKFAAASMGAEQFYC